MVVSIYTNDGDVLPAFRLNHRRSNIYGHHCADMDAVHKMRCAVNNTWNVVKLCYIIYIYIYSYIEVV